jgi:hypothetical protein
MLLVFVFFSMRFPKGKHINPSNILPKGKKCCKKMKKACCSQALSLFNAFKMIDFLVLDDGIVRASASAGAATNA